MWVIYLCLSFILIEDVLSLYTIIFRLNAENFHSSRDRSRMYGDWSVCPYWNILIMAFEWVFVFKWCFGFYHDLISKSVILVNFTRFFADYVFLYFRCLCWLVYFQSSVWFIGRIIAWPNISCPALLPLFRWYVERTEKGVADSIPIHGSESYTYVSCTLYVCARFSGTWCIISMVALTCGLPEETGLLLIHYYFSIKLFLNLRPRNYPPLDQPCSLYQVRGYHHFLVSILRYFKPPSYGLYHCNGF